MKFSASDVSVVIPSYNSRFTIGPCLEALLNQEEAPGEIIVVDSSLDTTSGYVRSRFPQVRVFHFQHQIFPGPARNHGVDEAKGQIIAFIDSDCIPPSDWVKKMARHHSEGRLAVGGAIEVGNPDNLVVWAGHYSEFREFLPVGRLRPLWHVPTCNISYRRELLTQYGGFPNAYYPQEDMLFNAVLAQKGIPVWFDPEMRVRHFYRNQMKPFLSHQHRIGRVTYSTLRRVRLPGSALAHNTSLAWLFAPLLGGVKFFRTAIPLVRYSPGLAISHLEIFGLLLMAAAWWARGFAAGAYQGLNGKSAGDDPDEPIFKALSSNRKAPKTTIPRS